MKGILKIVMESKNENQNFPPAAERTLQILDYFANDPSSKTLKTIADALSIPSTSLYRIINCMQEYRYIVEDPKRPNYFKPGYKLSQFSNIVSTEKDLIKLARPYMEELVKKSSQACQLCTLTESGICTIDQCLPHSGITYISKLGETLPVNVSAAGKLLTALLPPKKQKSFLKRASNQFRQHTPNTIIDMELFQKELNRIEKLRYGTDTEEYAIGIGCIAVPIYNTNKEPIAAIGVTGPIEFYQNMNNFHLTLGELLEISSKIEQLL